MGHKESQRYNLEEAMPKSRPKFLERRKDSKVLVAALQVSRLYIGKNSAYNRNAGT